MVDVDEVYKLRLDFSRDNPVIGDKPIIFREEVEVPGTPASEKTVVFDVPQGLKIYIVGWAGNYVENSLWTFIVDDEYIETRKAPPQSLQDYQKIYTPPIIAHNKIEIRIKNNNALPQTYVVEVRGWQRK